LRQGGLPDLLQLASGEAAFAFRIFVPESIAASQIAKLLADYASKGRADQAADD